MSPAPTAKAAFSSWLCLSLLDDAPLTPLFRRHPSPSLPPPAPLKPAGAETTASPLFKAGSSGARTPAARAKAASRSSTGPGQPTIFRDHPSLRELMSEYNRRSSSLGGRLLKFKAQKPGSSIVSPENFAFDRVEAIRLPSIPGKILRPC